MMKKVILVDDSATVLMSASMALTDMIGAGIIEFKTYSNPLNLINDIENGITYDLLITDINMPEMNGFDLTKKLKSIPSVQKKPIIALTTESSPEMKSQGKSAGLVGWITKPFSNEKLIMGLKRVLRIR